MKLQYLSDASGKCPLIRLFDFNTDEAALLLCSLEALASKTTDSLLINELPFITTLENVALTAMIDERPRNPDSEFSIVEGPQSTPLIWRANLQEWRRICDSIRPFVIECRPDRYAWLTDDLGTQVLISPSGTW